jgi:hypothetical protein
MGQIILGAKVAFSQKNNVMIKFLQKTNNSLSKKRQFFRKFFW